MRDGFAVDKADVVVGRHHAGQLQVVMRLKQGPVGTVDLVNFHADPGRASKTPPFELGRAGVDHPVWVQPLHHVVVTGDPDELSRTTPPGFGKGGRADPGDAAVNGGGEFIDNGQRWALAEQTGQVGAELFAIG